MKRIFVLFVALSGVILSNSCRKDPVLPPVSAVSTISADYSNNSKLLVDNNGKIRWNANDYIFASQRIGDNLWHTVSFVVDKGVGAENATFKVDPAETSTDIKTDYSAGWVNYHVSKNVLPYPSNLYMPSFNPQKADSTGQITNVYIPAVVDTATVIPAIAYSPAGLRSVHFTPICAALNVKLKSPFSIIPVTIEVENISSDGKVMAGPVVVTGVMTGNYGLQSSTISDKDTLDYLKITKSGKASTDASGYSNLIAIRGDYTTEGRKYEKVRFSVYSANQVFFCDTLDNMKVKVGKLTPLTSQPINCVEELQPANTFLIQNAGMDGIYKFKAVEGNSTTPVTAESVKQVWDSEYAANNNPKTSYSVVKNLKVEDGYIYFVAGSTPGLAQIAACDNSGNVTWSWTIWVPSDEVKDVTLNTDTTSTVIMDHTLGSNYASAPSYGPGTTWTRGGGCYYQFGRSTPFPPKWGKTGDDYLQYYANGSEFGSADGPVTVSEAIKNPMTFYKSNYSWCYTEDNKWVDASGKKSKYDPCPAGYKSIDEAAANVLVATRWTSVGTYAYVQFDGVNLTTTYASNSNALDGSTGEQYLQGGTSNTFGLSCYIWASNAKYFFSKQNKTTASLKNDIQKSYACNVRCMAE